MQPSSSIHNKCEIYQREILFDCFMTTLNDVFETELAQKDDCYESGSDYFNTQTLLSRAPRIYHVSMVDDLSLNLVNFGQSPTTTGQCAESSPCRNCNTTHYQLVFTSLDDKSPIRSSKCYSQQPSSDDRGQDLREADVSSSVHHNLCHYITPTTDQFLTEAWDDDTTSFEEHFQTAPLDDDVWAEEPIPDSHLCIHERPDKLKHQCSYPCPNVWTYCNQCCKRSSV